MAWLWLGTPTHIHFYSLGQLFVLTQTVLKYSEKSLIMLLLVCTTTKWMSNKGSHNENS